MPDNCNPMGELIDVALDSTSFSLIEDEKAFNGKSLRPLLEHHQAQLKKNLFQSVFIISPQCKDSITLIFSLITSQRSFICGDRGGTITLWLKQFKSLPVDALAIHESLVSTEDSATMPFTKAVFSNGFYWFSQTTVQTQCLLPGIGFYSSGSTSQPKAVLHPYKAIYNYLQWGKKTLQLTHSDKFLFTTELSFIASLRPLLFPIVGKHAVIITPHKLLINAAKFLRFIQKNHVTIISTTPSFLKYLCLNFKSQETLCTSLRLIILSGEPCEADTINIAYNFFGHDIQIYDIYGTTEVLAPFYKSLPPNCSQNDVRLLGKIRSGYRYTLHQYKKNYHQIHLSGEVSANYLNPCEVENHFTYNNGTRYYCSDDLFRRQNDGIIFSTRRQHLIKQFGKLINLKHIQEEILQLQNIKECVVIFSKARRHIEAYVVSSDKNDPTNEIKAHLEKALPDYMRPKQLIALPSIPLNKHGKVDTRQLSQNSSAAKEDNLLEFIIQLTGSKDVNLQSSVFSLKLNSIDYIELSQFLLKEKHLRLDFSAINEETTIESLSHCMLPTSKHQHHVKNILPLCNAQKSIVKLYYLKNKINKGSYSHTLKLKRNICLNKLETAVIKTVKNHFMLSCRLKRHDGQYFFEYVPAPKKAKHHFIITLIKRIKRQSVPLHSQRLFDAYIFEKNNNHFLRLNFHHIICDAWSMWNVVSEIFNHYDNTNYTQQLSFNNEISLISAFVKTEKKDTNTPISLPEPISYKYFKKNEYHPLFLGERGALFSQSYFVVPKDIITAFQAKHHLEQCSMKTTLLLICALTVSEILNINTVPIAITLSKRGMPLEDLRDMTYPCVTISKIVIPLKSISLKQTAAIIENDLHLLFSYACSNQILKLSQTPAYQEIVQPDIIYTYADFSQGDASTMNKYINWKQSTFNYQNFLDKKLFIRTYYMGDRILFFINNSFSRHLSPLIKEKIAALLQQ